MFSYTVVCFPLHDAGQSHIFSDGLVPVRHPVSDFHYPYNKDREDTVHSGQSIEGTLYINGRHNADNCSYRFYRDCGLPDDGYHAALLRNMARSADCGVHSDRTDPQAFVC